MTWVLIVLVVISSHQSSSQAVVPGFHNEAACVAAANAYLKNLANVQFDPSHLVSVSATCVQQ